MNYHMTTKFAERLIKKEIGVILHVRHDKSVGKVTQFDVIWRRKTYVTSLSTFWEISSTVISNFEKYFVRIIWRSSTRSYGALKKFSVQSRVHDISQIVYSEFDMAVFNTFLYYVQKISQNISQNSRVLIASTPLHCIFLLSVLLADIRNLKRSTLNGYW